MSDGLPRFEVSARRGLDAAYKQYGRPCTYLPPNGAEGVSIDAAIFAVSDVEENLEGASVEAAMRNYTLRVRTWLIPNGVSLKIGGVFTLSAPFYGHTFFKVSEAPRAYQRGGRQTILQITPVEDPALPSPPGYSFG